MARALAAALLAAGLVALSTGCRARRPPDLAPPRPAPLEVAGMRGQRVLVVAGDASSSGLVPEVARHLSALPLRPCTAEELGGPPAAADGGEPTAEDWKAWAWERRIPYLLMLSDAGDDGEGGGAADHRSIVLAVQASRGGGEVASWRIEDVLPSAIPMECRVRVRGGLGLEDVRPDGHPSSWLTVPADTLRDLSTRVVMAGAGGEGGDAASPGGGIDAEIDALEDRYPLDTALLDLRAVRALDAGDPGRARQLATRAQAFNPDGRSEVPALARAAGAAGLDAREERLWSAANENRPGRLDVALELAEMVGDGGDHERAARILGDALNRRPRDAVVPEDLDARPDRPVVLATLARAGDGRYLLGWHLYSMGEHDAAMAAYTEARDLFDVVGEPDSVAACHNNMGVALMEAGRPVAAIPLLRRALQTREAGGDSEGLATTLYNMGAALQGVGRNSDAVVAFQRAAVVYGTIGAAEEQRETWLEALVLLGEGASVDAVERAFQRYLELAADAEPAEEWRARGLDALGVALGRMGEHAPAMEALEEALGIWIERGDRLHEGQTRYNMAIPHLARGEIDEALRCLRDARAIALELGDAESIVDIDVQMEQIEKLR